MPVSLLFFDIDHFKRVNDEEGGHAVGDEALVAVAEITKAVVEGKGTAFRYAGDEFIVLLPNHTTDEAVAVAERLRRAVNTSALTSRSLTLSLSIGIAVAPEHARDLAGLKAAADKALYDAKRLGRNLVRVIGEDVPQLASRILQRRQPDPSVLTDSTT
jgi:diguanylate cyclase (GGDEF)-like protein